MVSFVTLSRIPPVKNVREAKSLPKLPKYVATKKISLSEPMDGWGLRCRSRRQAAWVHDQGVRVTASGGNPSGADAAAVAARRPLLARRRDGLQGVAGPGGWPREDKKDSLDKP
jgi:hypothetical protein